MHENEHKSKRRQKKSLPGNPLKTVLGYPRSGLSCSCSIRSRSMSSSGSSNASSSSGSKNSKVNIAYPPRQETFASLLQLYLEFQGAEVTVQGGACGRQVVLLPLEGQRSGLEGWLEEVGGAVTRGEHLLAVVEERGEWRSTDPWLREVEVGESILWVHDYQEACVQRMVERLRLGEQEVEEHESRRMSRRGRELWTTLRKNFQRTRTLSVDSGYNSS